MNDQHFMAWTPEQLAAFQGSRDSAGLHTDRDERFQSVLFAILGRREGFEKIYIIDNGACFGFVQEGRVRIEGSGMEGIVRAGQWFSVANGCRLEPSWSARGYVVKQIGFRGMNCIGGPIEERGRLKYIDGCSDSLLCSPPLLGDPCLNHLHFPPNIDQTEHTHPSVRMGIVAGGRGQCITPAGEAELVPGLIFCIPMNGRHKFRTSSDSGMDVIAYHPDSDWGPTHEEHPMVNRTWVDGRKIDNRTGVHAEADIVAGHA